jgi:hypothetical protein
MITGKLSNGFEVEVDETIVKTYKFSKIIGKACSKDANERLYANAIILEYLLGEDGEEALLDYVRENTGHEPTESEITALTLEIINLMKTEDEEIKKSVSSEDL